MNNNPTELLTIISELLDKDMSHWDRNMKDVMALGIVDKVKQHYASKVREAVEALPFEHQLNLRISAQSIRMTREVDSMDMQGNPYGVEAKYTAAKRITHMVTDNALKSIAEVFK